MNSLLEQHQKKEELAVFKFGIIAPLVNNTAEYKSKESFYKQVAEKEYVLPDNKKAKFTCVTIKSWYLKYMKFGFEGLKTNVRNDVGTSRKLSEEIFSNIKEIRAKFPYITGKAIYNKLVEDNIIKASEVSLSSLYRYLNVHKLEPENNIDRRAFEFEFANDCWQRRYVSRT